MAGGTGGHVFPGLAVADEMRGRGWNVVWMGARSGMEARLVPARGYPVEWIRAAALRGKGLAAALMLPFHLLIGFWQSARAILRLRPAVVLSMGGYVAFPGGMMASLLARPLACTAERGRGPGQRACRHGRQGDGRVSDTLRNANGPATGARRDRHDRGRALRSAAATAPAGGGRQPGRAGAERDRASLGLCFRRPTVCRRRAEASGIPSIELFRCESQRRTLAFIEDMARATPTRTW